MNTILVLCLGNICRSPIAEALFKQKMPDKHIHSAGIKAMVGWQADPNSVAVSKEHGIDISQHRAKQCTPEMVKKADLIIVMEQSQKKHMEQMYPTAHGKIFCLGQFGKGDIADPYGKSRAEFELTYALIKAGVDEISERLFQF